MGVATLLEINLYFVRYSGWLPASNNNQMKQIPNGNCPAKDTISFLITEVTKNKLLYFVICGSVLLDAATHFGKQKHY